MSSPIQAPLSSVAPGDNPQLAQLLSQLPGAGQPVPSVQGGAGGGEVAQPSGATLSDTVTGLAPPNFDTPYATAGDVQKALVPQLQDVLKQFQESTDPKSSSNQTLAEQLKALTYTPEMRAQDMYNKAFGIGQKPGDLQLGTRSPTGELNLVQGPNKNNVLKAITTGAMELPRYLAGIKSGNYQSPMERYREQATKEYTAEAIPAARDLLYETQNRRNLMNSADSLIRTFAQNQATDARVKVAQARAEADNYAKGLVTPSLVAEHNARIQQISQMTDINAQKLAMEQEMQRMKEITGGQTGALGAVNERQYLAKTQGEAAANKMWNDYLTTERVQGSGRTPLHFVEINGKLMGLDPHTGAARDINYGDLQNAQGGEEAITPDLQQKVKDYYKGESSYLGNIHYNAPFPSQMNQEERAILSSQPLEPTPKGGELTKVDAAVQGYRATDAMKKIVASLNPKDLGTFSGLFNKILANNTTESDPAWTSLFANANVAAAAHTAVQSFRNAGYADKIAMNMALTQTNPAAINSALGAYQGTFLPALQAHRGYVLAQPFINDVKPDEVMRILHPSMYSEYIKRIYNQAKQRGLVQ
jgi:hypothetical protein